MITDELKDLEGKVIAGAKVVKAVVANNLNPSYPGPKNPRVFLSLSNDCVIGGRLEAVKEMLEHSNDAGD